MTVTATVTSLDDREAEAVASKAEAEARAGQLTGEEIDVASVEVALVVVRVAAVRGDHDRQ